MSDGIVYNTDGKPYQIYPDDIFLKKDDKTDKMVTKKEYKFTGTLGKE